MKLRPVTGKDFKFKNLTKVETSIVAIHLLLSAALFALHQFALVPTGTLRGWINGYYFFVPFVIVGPFSKKLRNFKFYLTWLAISVVQFSVYFAVCDIPEFLYPRGTAFSGMRALLPALILFQFFRLILLRNYGRELIVSIRFGRLSMWEDDENRRMTWVEIVCSLILLATIILLNVV